MKSVTLLATALCIAGCARSEPQASLEAIAPYGAGIEFTDTTKQRQTVDIEGIRGVTIRCLCQNHRVEIDYRATDITLEITGTYSISGYHGSKEEAGAVPLAAGALHFSTSRDKDVLTLESAEWQYLHHSTVIDELSIKSPVPVHFEHYTHEQLLGLGERGRHANAT